MRKTGFTLTEMLIVVFILSGLMVFMVPNLLDSKEQADNKSCSAYIKVVTAQVELYQLNNEDVDLATFTLEELKQAGYIDSLTCPNGAELTFDQVSHEVIIKEDDEEQS